MNFISLFVSPANECCKHQQIGVVSIKKQFQSQSDGMAWVYAVRCITHMVKEVAFCGNPEIECGNANQESRAFSDDVEWHPHG